MEPVTSCCCGLDVPKKNVVACLRRIEATGELQIEVRTFSTMTHELLALAAWLKEASCEQVAMESTGVYWKPVFNLLHMDVEVLVVNAQHMKAVPGRKTDVRDAEWIAELLHFGLLRGSYIPPQEQRELRELTRYRTTVVQERARFINRLPKVLEDAKVKRGAVATNILGRSARAMLEAIVAGERDPALLADLARGTLRTKRAAVEQALTGRVMGHHRFLISELLGQIEYLDAAIERVTIEIGTRLQDESDALALLDTIPGVSQRTAEILLAEIGSDLSRFPSAKHLASWAGMCPGNDESAGKRKSGRTRKGSPWLPQALTEAAQAAARTKNTYLGALYRRIAARRGKKKAVLAVGHSILVSVYYILTRRESYQDLGANYFDERDRRAVERRLVRRLEQLGNTVTLAPRVPVPEVTFSE
ncbi:MAG: IS110 family transposase [Ardenticatenaceae bacterium]|nr:IS110 family transposase [Ardenticatenaceae bacterium]